MKDRRWIHDMLLGAGVLLAAGILYLCMGRSLRGCHWMNRPVISFNPTQAAIWYVRMGEAYGSKRQTARISAVSTKA